MKMKKRFMIALAGAIIIGVFGTSGTSMMADEAEEPEFMLTIPGNLTINGIGYNEAQISGKIKRYGDYNLNVFTDEKFQYDIPIRFLENTTNNSEDRIPYMICAPMQEWDESPSPTTVWTLSGPGEIEEYFGVFLFDETDVNRIFNELNIPQTPPFRYEELSPGEYKDTVTFTAKLEQKPQA